MAARFLFQKFPSRMSGSKRLLRSCESASASAGAQVTHAASESSIRTLTDLSNGAAVHPWTAVSNNGGIRACSIRALTNVSHGTGFCPRIAVRSKSGIHACAFVDSVGGEKRAFSSDVSTRNRISRKAKMATWAAEWDAKSAAWQAQQATWRAEIEANTADFNKFLSTQACLWGFTCFCWIFGDFLEDCARSYNGKSSSTHASSCGN